MDRGSMKKVIVLLLITILTSTLTTVEQNEDIIDIKNITVFPQQYVHNIRAGFFNITPFKQSFYYIFCESQSSPEEDPVILWLNGGPGCSSLTGFFTQNGPFSFKQQDPSKMYINDNSWNKKANILYLQNPGGVGFAFADQQYLYQNDTSVAKDSLMAVRMFFQRYTQYKGNQFYIAGESYAGVYIPRLAKEIVNYNQAITTDRINLIGILIGNACTHPFECYTSPNYSRFSTQFWYTRGFIDEDEYLKYKQVCLESYSSEKTAACKTMTSKISTDFVNSQANIYNIYAKCYRPVYPPLLQQKIDNYHKKEHSLKHPLRCTDAIGPMTVLNRNQFRLAFKIQEFNDTLSWTPCSDTLHYTIEPQAAYSTVWDLVKAGLRIFYFSGDQDAIVPITGTLWWFDQFRKDHGLPIKKSWRPWVTQNQNISGMVWQLEGMTLATVRGAGHMVPSDKPLEGVQILNVFLGNKEWTYPDYYIQ